MVKTIALTTATLALITGCGVDNQPLTYSEVKELEQKCLDEGDIPHRVTRYIEDRGHSPIYVRCVSIEDYVIYNTLRLE